MVPVRIRKYKTVIQILVIYSHQYIVTLGRLPSNNFMFHQVRHNLGRTNLDGHIVLRVDFGVSRFLKVDSVCKTLTGTVLFRAPEVESSGYTKQAHLWSCRNILYVMLNGFLPFNTTSVVSPLII